MHIEDQASTFRAAIAQEHEHEWIHNIAPQERYTMSLVSMEHVFKAMEVKGDAIRRMGALHARDSGADDTESVLGRCKALVAKHFPVSTFSRVCVSRSFDISTHAQTHINKHMSLLTSHHNACFCPLSLVPCPLLLAPCPLHPSTPPPSTFFTPPPLHPSNPPPFRTPPPPPGSSHPLPLPCLH